jgi:hypothetical protein
MHGHDWSVWLRRDPAIGAGSHGQYVLLRKCGRSAEHRTYLPRDLEVLTRVDDQRPRNGTRC